MRKLIFLIFPFCLSITVINSAFSQNTLTEKDSVQKLIDEAKTYVEKIKLYKNLGYQSGKLNFDDVIALSSQGIQFAQTEKDKEAEGILERNIGNSFYFKGDYTNAANHFYKSVNILERENRQLELAETYNSTAKLYRKIRELDKASAYYERALQLYSSMKDTSGLATIYNEYGVVFEYKEDYKKADTYYSKSLSLNQMLKNLNGICYALGNLSGLYALQQDYKKAEQFAFKSLAIRKILNDSLSMALNYGDIGSLYKAAGEHRRALQYFDSSLSIAKTMNYVELQSQNYQSIGDVKEAQGNTKEALQYFHLHRKIADSLYNIQKSAQVEELNTRYETGKKENEILAQKLEIRNKNNSIVVVFSVAILAALIGWSEYRKFAVSKENEKQAAIAKGKIEVTQAVIDAEESERQRIAGDLHDGVGQVLSAARMNFSALKDQLPTLTEEQKLEIKKISSLIDKGCSEVRSVSHQMMPLDLQHNKFHKAVENFVLNLTGNNFKTNVFIEGIDVELSFEGQNILYRIIQECVNNVIKHSKASQLDVSIIKDEEQLAITIEDNGIGFDVEDAKSKAGVGLKNIRTRLKYLNGSMELNSAKGAGTCVMLFVPIKDRELNI